MKKILIISFTNPLKDPRVNRQINFLKDEYTITVVGSEFFNDEKVNSIVIKNNYKKNKLQKLRRAFSFFILGYENFYWSSDFVKDSLEKLKEKSFDLIIANDLETLPLIIKVSKNAKVISDLHEYAPLEFENSLFWRLFKKKAIYKMCKEYLIKANILTTVCENIAKEYEKNFDIVKPKVITNAPPYYKTNPKIINEDDIIKIVHHGVGMRPRKIENMINVMRFLDNKKYELNLIIVPNDLKYLKELKELAKGLNINFLDPVPMTEISASISKFDIGLYIIEPSSLNNEFSLPNKFFEFIQARLALAIGPSIEMATIAKKYDCGVVAKDFSSESMAKEIEKLDYNKINYFKEKSHLAAKELCAEENKKILTNIIDKLLKN